VTRGDNLDIALLGNRGVFQNAEAMELFKSYIHDELYLLRDTVKANLATEAGTTTILM